MAELADKVDLHRAARTVSHCLEYLHHEALSSGIPITAHLIGVASKSALDFLSGIEEPSISAAQLDTSTHANHAGNREEDEQL